MLMLGRWSCGRLAATAALPLLLLSVLLACAVGVLAAPAARRATGGGPRDPMRVNEPLVPFALEPLRWGSVSPRGWLRDWAEAARNGAGSPSRAAFANVKPNGHSVDGWRHGRPGFGGFWDEDSAYWVDGMTRLGLVLNDTELVARVRADYEFVMANPWQFHNTFPGDIIEGWVRSIYSRGMLAYYDGTSDDRVVKFLARAFANYTAADSTCPMACDESRQGSRSTTQIEALLEGHAYGGPPQMRELALALLGPSAQNGADAFMQTLLSGCADNATAVANGECEQHTHGVTFNEVAKLFAMGYSWSGNASLLEASVNAYRMVERFDTQPHGVNSADEDMNGISPNLATETCDVADFTYSQTWMLRITGDGAYGDALERAFYNAAPGTVNRTFDGHVYFQSPNFAPNAASEPYPNGVQRWQEAYWHAPPCCTGNMVRILPNYIHHTWWGTPDGGLACAMYAPSSVAATVGGRSVTVASDTDYPFNSTVVFSVSISGCDAGDGNGGGGGGGGGVAFPLLLRVPRWLSDAGKTISVSVNGEAVAPAPDPTLRQFVRVERTWHDGDRVDVDVALVLRATRGVTVANGWNDTAPWGQSGRAKTNDDLAVGDGVTQARLESASAPDRPARLRRRERRGGGLLGAGHLNVTAGLPFCVVERGPLLFALSLEGSAPGSPSAYGYAVDCDALAMTVSASPLQRPFDWPAGGPVRVHVRAAAFDWVGGPWRLPDDPVDSLVGTTAVNLTLTPYGSAKVFHVSMFPVLKR